MAPQRRKPGLAPIDATELIPDLYQGSAPPPGPLLASWGFDAVVLTAKEYQPVDAAFPGLVVVRAKIDDYGAPMTEDEWKQAVLAASKVVGIYEHGGKVLVTCAMGRNRSGLVSALALHMLTGLSGADVVREVRALRPGALRNDWFVRALRELPACRLRPRGRMERAE